MIFSALKLSVRGIILQKSLGLKKYILVLLKEALNARFKIRP